MLSVALTCFLAAAPSGKPKLVVLDLSAAGGVEPAVASAMTEAVVAEVSARGFFDVVSSRDVQTLLGRERQLALMGCSEGTSCLAELAGAMGARFVMNGSVARLGGDTYQLNLQTLDSGRAQPVGRSTRLAKDVAELRKSLPFSVAEATGTPAPPPPSRALPFTLMAVGAAGALTASVVGVTAISDQGSLNAELKTSDVSNNYVTTYQQRANSIVLGKAVALAGIAAGAALVGVGVYLYSSNDARVAVVPTASGVAFAGSWR